MYRENKEREARQLEEKKIETTQKNSELTNNIMIIPTSYDTSEKNVFDNSTFESDG